MSNDEAVAGWAEYADMLTRMELDQHLYAWGGTQCLWCDEPREEPGTCEVWGDREAGAA